MSTNDPAPEQSTQAGSVSATTRSLASCPAPAGRSKARIASAAYPEASRWLPLDRHREQDHAVLERLQAVPTQWDDQEVAR